VTVMLDKFFGVHPHVIRSGLWSRLKPGEINLYIYLMAESERCCTRQMRRRDADVTAAVGVAGRTLCNARKKLQEYRLVLCDKGEGNKYIYTICNPETGEPYPGDSRDPITCAKRTNANGARRAESHMPSDGRRAVSEDYPSVRESRSEQQIVQGTQLDWNK
jgi:hypothetical protein